MSKDIRSFFTVLGSKSSSGNSKTPEVIKKKKPKVIKDSSDEDVINSTPDLTATKVKKHVKRKHQVISSDSEGEVSIKNQNEARKEKSPAKHSSKLKPVNFDDAFSDTPIKQSKVEPIPKLKEEHLPEKHGEVKRKKKRKAKGKTELGVHNDEDFEKTLLDLDDDLINDNADFLDQTINEALSHTDQVEQKTEKQITDLKTLTSSPPREERSKAHEKLLGETDTPEHGKPTPSKEKQRKRPSESIPDQGTPSSKKIKLEHSDSGMDPGQEAYEKKRYSAMLYQKYIHRGGPKHHGQKELPKGKPDCLKNLCFLRTGVLDSLESSEFEGLIKEHGGRVVHAVSKKVNYIVVGEDSGPAKLEKARNYNIPCVSEDELLDMILTKSGMKPKFVKHESDTTSEDLGIGTEEEVSPKSNKSDKESEHIPIKMEERSLRKKSLSEKEPSLSKLTSKEPENEVVYDIIKKEIVSPKNTQEVSVEKHLSGNKIVKSEDLERIEMQKIQVSDCDLQWTDKYKPTDLKGIIGQQGEKSVMNKLRKWLQNWQKFYKKPNKIRPSPWAKDDDGSYFKCALLSGSPGVGKTTMATLVSKDLGFDVVEFNASDTRSKKLLHQEVSTLLKTTSVAGFALGHAKTERKRVLLMDEVDGMAGNEDRGGIQELINLIKTTSVPIICMCNDRNHQKMRSLVNYCFDLKVTKPKPEQIRGAMMSVCFKEGLKLSPQALIEIINGAGCDIRQTLTHLSLWTAAEKNLSKEQAEKDALKAQKDTVLGPWEVCRKVFNEADHKSMSIADRARLFFYDYSLGPLFVQQNYLGVIPNVPNNDKRKMLRRACLAADSISMGDIIDSKIRGSNNWSLLESQAFFSSVLPGHYMSGHMACQINFPSWLGNNSRKTKFKRILNELHIHTRISTYASKMAIKLDYLLPLRNAVLMPLIKEGSGGVEKAVEAMNTYNLLREDLDNLVELCQWKKKDNIFSKVDPKLKTAFTRMYNKKAPLLPYAATSGVSKKKNAALDTDYLNEEETLQESDTEDKDDVTADAMIKVKTKTDKGKKESAKASISKKGDTKKGKGKK